MVAAETPYAEYTATCTSRRRFSTASRYPADLAALQAVSGKGVPVVTVLYSGRPLPANDLINLSDAFVAAFLPGTEGRGLADLLLAGANGRALRLHRPAVLRLARLGLLDREGRRVSVPRAAMA